MRISKGRTYRHRSCIDIDMHVLNIAYMGPDYFKLKVCYVNRHNGMLYQQSGTVKVYYRDLGNWEWVPHAP